MKILAEVGQWLDENAERISGLYPELNDELGNTEYLDMKDITIVVMAYHIIQLEMDQ